MYGSQIHLTPYSCSQKVLFTKTIYDSLVPIHVQQTIPVQSLLENVRNIKDGTNDTCALNKQRQWINFEKSDKTMGQSKNVEISRRHFISSK